jgi:hypothetical protein
MAAAMAAVIAACSAGPSATELSPSEESTARTAQAFEARDAAVYRVFGVSTKEQRSAVTRTGAVIREYGPDYVIIDATPSELAYIESLGYTVEPEVRLLAFPGQEAYHNYDEMQAEIEQAVTDHGNIVSMFSIGNSYEGRAIWAAKISDNVATDENEPEVLFIGGQHAREHLGVEMTLYLLKLLTDNYQTDDTIAKMVNSREIYIVFNANPDGSEYDFAQGSESWRKNRQPNEGSPFVGTDQNRNSEYMWGCCGGSSDQPDSESYRGPAPWSAPEAVLLAEFINNRVVNGVQQIKTAINFHSFNETVLYPYGYTIDDVPADMTQDDHDVFVTLGQGMASLNGYTAEQGSDQSITSGTIDDWAYRYHKIFMYTFELGGDSFYPPGASIDSLTSINRDAALLLLKFSGCPYTLIGKGGQYCATSEVVSSDVTVSPNSWGRASVACPSGTVATGGGFYDSSWLYVYNSSTSSSTGWTVYGWNRGTQNGWLRAYATCIPTSTGASVAPKVGSVSVPPNSVACARADCPANTLLTGGGFAAQRDRSKLMVYYDVPIGNSWYVCAQNSTTGSLALMSYAMCMSGVQRQIVRVSRSVSVTAGSYNTASAGCPRGSMVTGGGFYQDSLLDLVSTHLSYWDTLYGWDTYAINHTTSTRSLTSFGLCLW